MTKRNRIRFPWATTGNIIAAIVILTSAYLMTTGFYRATMVLHGEQAIRLLYVSAAWACVAGLACVVWFGVWFLVLQKQADRSKGK